MNREPSSCSDPPQSQSQVVAKVAPAIWPAARRPSSDSIASELVREESGSISSSLSPSMKDRTRPGSACSGAMPSSRRRKLMDQPKLMLATIKDNDVKQRSSRGNVENEQAKKANSGVVGDIPLHNVPSAVFGAVLVTTFYLRFSFLMCGVFAVSSSITSWSAVRAWRERKKRLLEEEDEDATDGDIDWTRKIRVFVGDLGIEAFAKSGPSNDDGDGGAGYLRSLEQTGLLRDALLLYANRRWIEAKEPPAPAMTLQLVRRCRPTISRCATDAWLRGFLTLPNWHCSSRSLLPAAALLMACTLLP